MTLLRWGLVPHWAANETTGHSMINARAETVATSPRSAAPSAGTAVSSPRMDSMSAASDNPISSV
ncbi:MAG: SOS response-associated peptidase [Pseudomonadota bacterium]|nr:SOS response-associated peptidase [Pseudomonadota bacterium]